MIQQPQNYLKNKLIRKFKYLKIIRDKHNKTVTADRKQIQSTTRLKRYENNGLELQILNMLHFLKVKGKEM